MSRIRYTSDLHFNHPYVAKLRGFTIPVSCGEPEHFNPCNLCAPGDAETHDEVIIENFNAGTRDDDLTIIAGDVAMNWKGVETKVARLRGRKILIEGNHDIMSGIHRDGWKHRLAWTGEDKFLAIMAYMRRKCAGQDFLISHYPYEGDHTETVRFTQYRLRDEGMWLLHGHTHNRNREPEHLRRSMLLAGDPLEKKQDWMWHGREIHVGLDAWNLRPVPEMVLIEMMNELDRKFGGVLDSV